MRFYAGFEALKANRNGQGLVLGFRSADNATQGYKCVRVPTPESYKGEELEPTTSFLYLGYSKGVQSILLMVPD